VVYIGVVVGGFLLLKWTWNVAVIVEVSAQVAKGARSPNSSVSLMTIIELVLTLALMVVVAVDRGLAWSLIVGAVSVLATVASYVLAVAGGKAVTWWLERRR
jgi:hypothetical protein